MVACWMTLTHVVEVGFGVQRLDGALEALPVVRRAEVVQTGRGAGTVF